MLVVFVAAGAVRRDLPDHPLPGAVGSRRRTRVRGAGRPHRRAVSIAAGRAGLDCRRRVLANGVVVQRRLVRAAGARRLVCVGRAAAGHRRILGRARSSLLVAEAVFTTHDPGWAAWVGGTCFAVVGLPVRPTAARPRRSSCARPRPDLALRAQAEERNRIARELHDVIAHSLTVSLMHVTSARLARARRRRPTPSRRWRRPSGSAGTAWTRCGTWSGCCGADGTPDPTTPLPGSVDVPALIERFRAAGADVRATVDGDLTALPGTVGLATYRILQEALTNATKHAPARGRPCTSRCAADAVRVDVDSSGRARPRHRSRACSACASGRRRSAAAQRRPGRQRLARARRAAAGAHAMTGVSAC